MSELEAFGCRVKSIRKKRNLSQEELAADCDLDRTYISGVERGQRNISLKNIHKIARALGISAASLLMEDHDAAQNRSE